MAVLLVLLATAVAGVKHQALRYFRTGERVCLVKVKVPGSSRGFFMAEDQDLIARGVVDPMLRFLQQSEPHIGQMLTEVLQCRADNPLRLCARTVAHDARHALVFMDIGASAGFYMLLAASLGISVIAVEPQPHCIAFLKAAAAASELFKISLHNVLAGNYSRPQHTSVRMRNGCFGTWPYAVGQMDAAINYFAGVDNSTVQIDLVHAASLVPANTSLILKIDTEGCEFEVLSGLRAVFEARRVICAVVEYNRAMRCRREGQPWDTCDPVRFKYHALVIYDWLAKAGYELSVFGLGSLDRAAFYNVVHEPTAGHWLTFDFLWSARRPP
eukprot:g28234.t1